MSGKTNRNSLVQMRRSLFSLSKTPSKSIYKQLTLKSELDSTISAFHSKKLNESSPEPLRMAIKLEDIIKCSKKTANSSTLKPELIEPEIESSIPCIEYVPKLGLSNLRPVSPVEGTNKGKKSIKNDITEFSLEKMDADCKEIEENIILEKNKGIIEEIEKTIAMKYGCKVKVVQDKAAKSLPSTVFVKSGENIEIFSISKC